MQQVSYLFKSSLFGNVKKCGCLYLVGSRCVGDIAWSCFFTLGNILYATCIAGSMFFP
jgi:hypothetical protein